MKLLYILTILIVSLFISVSHAKTIVKVGGYVFAPFVTIDATNKSKGMTIDLINILNKVQVKYNFKFILTSPKRRYQSFNNGHFDIMFFESKVWGWNTHSAVFSDVYLKGGEVYISRKLKGKDQHFFDNIKKKKMVVMRGYHYGFADFNADEIYLTKNFTSIITNSSRAIVELVLANRGDVGVVTKSFLEQYLLHNPEVKKDLIISTKFDQEYHHTILLRRDGLPSLKEMNLLLELLKKKGHLDKIWKKYGILK